MQDLTVPTHLPPLPLVRPKKVLALCDPAGGNVLVLARALANGLSRLQVAADVRPISDWDLEGLYGCQLLVVGTESRDFGHSEGARQFLERMRDLDLLGRQGFVFDVRASKLVIASIGAIVERRMKACKLELPFERECASVGDCGSLEKGEEKRFEELGLEIAKKVWRTEDKARQARSVNIFLRLLHHQAFHAA